MRYINLACLLAAAAMITGCAASVVPILQTKPSHIASASVTMVKMDEGTVNLPEDLRVKVMQEASRYSPTGDAKTLKINITNFHVKNPVQSWLIGDSDRISADVEVIDKRSGKTENKFQTFSIRVGVQGIAGAVISAINNPVDVEQELATALSKQIFLQLFGEAKAEVAAQRAPAKIAARYPRSYEELKVELKCRQDYENSKVKPHPGASPIEYSPSEQCKKYIPSEKKRRD